MSTSIARRTIFTHDLSYCAIDYLRALVHKQRRAGEDAARVAAYANAWAAGYRAWHIGWPQKPDMSEIAQGGWDYAHGEDCWLRCMEVDAAQDSRDAAGWPAAALW